MTSQSLHPDSVIRLLPGVTADIFSSDYLQSTLHRVALPPLLQDGGVSRPLMTRSRYSIPYFVAPDPTAVIECLSVCMDDAHNPARYPPVTQGEYREMRARGQYL